MGRHVGLQNDCHFWISGWALLLPIARIGSPLAKPIRPSSPIADSPSLSPQRTVLQPTSNGEGKQKEPIRSITLPETHFATLLIGHP